MQKLGTEIGVPELTQRSLVVVAGLRCRQFNPLQWALQSLNFFDLFLAFNKISLMMKHVKCASELG